MISDQGVDNLNAISLLISLLEAVESKLKDPKQCTTADLTPSDALCYSCLVESMHNAMSVWANFTTTNDLPNSAIFDFGPEANPRK